MTKNNKTSRREFTKRLALVASTPVLTTFCATSTPTDAQNLAPQSIEQNASMAAKGLVEVVRTRYGQNINKDDWPKIESAIARNFTMAEKLKQTKLKNGDEPATIFHA